jgi:uncharacterized protein YdiU (UPF0061 family)
MSLSIGQIEAHYARLPEGFFAALPPTPVAAPRLIAFNDSLARELGLSTDGVSPEDLARLFAGNEIPFGATPVAVAYAGHQFGSFVPQLGDGRAILLGEVRDRSGRLRDIAFKGSGRTPYSRGGDGRAALGPVLREYIVSEAMHALGVPTTRALAAVLTGERVLREQGPLPGAVFTREAASHLRVGTFQFFAAREDHEAPRALLSFAIERHDPTAKEADNPALAFLKGVIERQAHLIARWMSLGFVHGVMNTDNMTISGETIDYGPCAFMEAYDPATVFSSIDQFGRYAYGRQAAIAQWNLARLAEALLPLIDADEERAVKQASDAISGFAHLYHKAYDEAFRAKLGLWKREEEDQDLIASLLLRMQQKQADFTLTFRAFFSAVDPQNDQTLRQFLGDDDVADALIARWRERLQREEVSQTEIQSRIKAANPKRIPRNHRVEEVIQAAQASDDFEPFHRLIRALHHPYEDDPEYEAYEAPAAPHERVRVTFCGT